MCCYFYPTSIYTPNFRLIPSDIPVSSTPEYDTLPITILCALTNRAPARGQEEPNIIYIRPAHKRKMWYYGPTSKRQARVVFSGRQVRTQYEIMPSGGRYTML